MNDLRFENLSVNENYNDYYEEKTNGNHNPTAERIATYPPSHQNNTGVLKSPVNQSAQPTKRVSFSDPNANQTMSNHNSTSNTNSNNNNHINNNNNSMEKIIEDPNVSFTHFLLFSLCIDCIGCTAYFRSLFLNSLSFFSRYCILSLICALL